MRVVVVVVVVRSEIMHAFTVNVISMLTTERDVTDVQYEREEQLQP
jgi:hypothetical protein